LHGRALVEVEELLEEAAPPLLPPVAVAVAVVVLVVPASVAVTVAVTVVAPVVARALLLARRGRRGRGGRDPVEDLVELAAVEPDAAALGAVVDLHALTGRDRQLDVGADGALHARQPTVVACRIRADTQGW